MFSISSEAKVGLFVLAGLIILGYMSFRVGEYGFGLRKGYQISAVFDNVAGLERDASVQIAGVEVGRVENIKLTDSKAHVIMRILPDVKLARDVKATIRTHGILGEKYIELIPGEMRDAYLREGDRITRVAGQADIDRLLNQIGSIADDIKMVTASLSRVMGGEEGEESLRSIVRNMRDLTDNINMVVKQNDEKFSRMIASLKDASLEMERTFASLSEITRGINSGEGTVGRLVKDETVVDSLDKTFASLQEITNKINEGRGTIGKLVHDEETVDNLNETLAGLNRYMTKAEQFRLFLSYRGEYLFDEGDAKSYLEVRIQPKEDIFYILGLVSDPRGKRTKKEYSYSDGRYFEEEKWEKDELLFNAEIAKRYRDIVLRGGILESTGGVGIDYFAFKDDLKLSFEAFDFDEDRDPHLKIYGQYRLFKHIYLSAGWDDFISDEGNESLFVGASIQFEDEDLKYLLTSAPIPKD